MSDLVEFLKARLYSDECYARNAFGAHNDAGPDWREIWSGGLEVGSDVINTCDSQVSRFMERFDPARVLREVEAKRERLNRYLAMKVDVLLPTSGVDGNRAIISEYERVILPLDALPHADHPDYRQEWKP